MEGNLLGRPCSATEVTLVHDAFQINKVYKSADRTRVEICRLFPQVPRISFKHGPGDVALYAQAALLRLVRRHFVLS